MFSIFLCFWEKNFIPSHTLFFPGHSSKFQNVRKNKVNRIEKSGGLSD